MEDYVAPIIQDGRVYRFDLENSYQKFVFYSSKYARSDILAWFGTRPQNNEHKQYDKKYTRRKIASKNQTCKGISL